MLFSLKSFISCWEASNLAFQYAAEFFLLSGESISKDRLEMMLLELCFAYSCNSLKLVLLHVIYIQSCCADVTSSLAELTIDSSVAHFPQISPRKIMNASLLMIWTDVNISSLVLRYSWWIFLLSWSNNCVTPVVSSGERESLKPFDSKNLSVMKSSLDLCPPILKPLS